MAYIAFVRRHAEAAGIAKIIPPQGSWEPDFTFDKKRKVPTKLLSVHQLQTKDTSAAVKHFWEDYNAFLDASGSNKPKKKPTFIGQEIDLYALYRVTMKRGGYHKVSEDKTWKEIVAALQVSVQTTHLFVAPHAASLPCFSPAPLLMPPFYCSDRG